MIVSARRLAVLAAGACIAASALARDDAYSRLVGEFNALATTPSVVKDAPAQLALARGTLDQLADAGRKARPHLEYIAQQRIDIVRAAAEVATLTRERDALQREHDRLLLAAARRDAAQARVELEKQRLQAQIRTEEAERLASEAEAARTQEAEATKAAQAAQATAMQAKKMAATQAQAAALAKKEAELASSLGGSGSGKASPSAPRVHRIPVRIFVSDKAVFAAGSSAAIRDAAAFVKAAGTPVRIEMRAATKALAEQRAQALRKALVETGIAGTRLTISAAAAKAARVELVARPSGD